MNQQILFNTIFNKTENDKDSYSFLEKTTEQFPYFGLAHFYKLKNALATENLYASIAAKTSLFFNNPYFLHAQLLENKNELLSDEDKLEEDKNKLQPIELEEKEIVTVEKEIANDEKVNEVVSIETPQNLPIAETVNSIISINVEKAINKDEMLFEPLHATDYFASQGIKLSENALGNDKLGLQLKSFTSWLKTMKKVHPDKLPMVNELVEKAVKTQAEKSNEEAEIVTEAMAEAFILQGKQIRAIEIYEKLSLLNPEKNAYFAAKIDQLKK